MALPLTAAELRGSGIQFAFEYLGSVPVIAALHEMTADMRPLVVKECINMVAAAIGLIPTPRPNVIMQPFLGEPRVTNHQIELNISTKALTIIHSDKREPERFNRMIARHNIEQVSFAAQGSEETSTADMFGYIAKLRNGTDRRCHVFRFKDVQRVMHIIDDAIRIATRDMAPQMAPPIQPTSGIVNLDPAFGQEPRRQPLAPSPRPANRNNIPDRPSPEPGPSCGRCLLLNAERGRTIASELRASCQLSARHRTPAE